jgi:hypothetical protein
VAKEIEGAWKTVEVGAEASLDEEEDWVLSQQGLYALLTAQLRTLYRGKNGHNPEPAQHGHENAVEGVTWEEISKNPSPESPLPQSPSHFCPQHQTKFRRYEKDGKFWYSHKAPDGWCREQPTMKMR